MALLLVCEEMSMLKSYGREFINRGEWCLKVEKNNEEVFKFIDGVSA